MEEQCGGARFQTLTRAGFPLSNRWSPKWAGRVAYTFCVGSATWLVALGDAMSSYRNEAEHVVLCVGAALYAVLPFVLAWFAIPNKREPWSSDLGKRHLIALIGGAVSIAFIQTAVAIAADIVRPHRYLEEDDSNALVLMLLSLVLAAAIVVPLTPIVHYANVDRASDDHAPRMRFRIGVALAINAVLRVIVWLLVFGLPGESFSVRAREEYALLYGPALLMLVVGLVEIALAKRVLDRIGRWIEDARAGRIANVRVRDGEGPELLEAPALLALSPYGEVALVEEMSEALDYRTADRPRVLGAIPVR